MFVMKNSNVSENSFETSKCPSKNITGWKIKLPKTDEFQLESPERAASVAALSNFAAIFSSTYSSLQLERTRAGTPRKTNVAPFLSKVTVAVPGFVLPFLQTTHGRFRKKLHIRHRLYRGSREAASVRCSKFQPQRGLHGSVMMDLR